MHRSICSVVSLHGCFLYKVCSPLGFPAGGVFGLFVCLFLGILSIAELVGRWGDDGEARHRPLAQSIEQAEAVNVTEAMATFQATLLLTLSKLMSKQTTVSD